MTAVRLPLEYYTPATDFVAIDASGGYVNLDVNLDSQAERASVTLTAGEARALAAMLDHYASELDR
jgi:hypothetical protein